MVRYNEYGVEMRDILLSVEQGHPELVGRYMNRFGINELPRPEPVEDESGKWRVWEEMPNIDAGDGSTYWVESFTPNTKDGYVTALTKLQQFVDPNPPAPPPKPKSKAKADGDA